MSAFLRFCARKVLPLIADIEVNGDISKLPKEGGYMLASNHLGRLDSLAVYYVLDNDDLIHPHHYRLFNTAPGTGVTTVAIQPNTHWAGIVFKPVYHVTRTQQN